MTYFVLTRAMLCPSSPPPHSNHPSAVKSHPGMKQKPSLWGMKAIELSFLSLMEQEGYRRSNVWGWVLLQARVVQVRGEGKIIYIYICSMPLAEMRQWTIHFYLFFLLCFIISQLSLLGWTSQCLFQQYVQCMSMFAGRIKIWLKNGAVNVIAFTFRNKDWSVITPWIINTSC